MAAHHCKLDRVKRHVLVSLLICHNISKISFPSRKNYNQGMIL